MASRSASPKSPITVEELRHHANTFLVSTAGVMTLLSTAVAAIGHQNILLTFFISALAAAAAFAATTLYQTRLPARLTVATVLAVQVMMLIFAASNMDASREQEAHMIFFVLNCYMLSYACWRALLLYNVLVVVHHAVLTFLAPAWVWSSDSGPSAISHLAVHAFIAIFLVGPLMFVSVQLYNMILGMHAALAAAAQATQLATAKAEEAERNRLMTIEERNKAEAERAAVTARQNEVVDALAGGLSRLSAGNLAQRLGHAFAPEYETLRADFNATLAQLQKAMREIRIHASGIRGNTGEIAGTTGDLSRRTEQQAANLEQTAAALATMTTTMHEIALNAEDARKTVSLARQDTGHSQDVLDQTIRAMAGIETSAREIGSIIGVIDEIAFQTNLLALNAGVEAARAGDAGRGFAVVATEVRALAQRSADAAKQIKTLIATSGQQVEGGVKLVGETGKVLGGIVEQVNSLNTTIGKIAQATQGQSGSLGEVNAAINQLDQVTQQNAAMVEETSAATYALLQEVEQLETLTSHFEVGEGKVAAMPPAPARRREAALV